MIKKHATLSCAKIEVRQWLQNMSTKVADFGLKNPYMSNTDKAYCSPWIKVQSRIRSDWF